MCTRVTLAEVRKLQKAAGILNENDIDYSLDEMLDDEGMLNEKKTRPCGYITLVNPPGERHDLTKYFDKDGNYQCLDLKSPSLTTGGHDLRGLRLATSDETDWALPPHFSFEESVQEDAVPKPTGPAACPPGYTSYATGLDPNGVACLQGPAPKSINGKPPKKVASTTASKPGAPVPLKEKAPLPGCGPMWDGQKAVEGVRWMLDGDPGRHSTCLLPGRKPDFKVEFGGRLYSLVPYTNQEGIQEAVGVSAAAPCGPTFTAVSTGPKPTDYACFPTNGLPQKINGKPIQKKVGSSTTPVGLKPGMKPQMEAEGEGSRGYYIFDLDEVLVKLTDVASQNEFKQKVQQKAAQDPVFKKAFLASKKEDSAFAKNATKYVDDQESVYDYTFDEWVELTIDSHTE
jgi:hypothetical protein